jgi:hypothetical protein
MPARAPAPELAWPSASVAASASVSVSVSTWASVAAWPRGWAPAPTWALGSPPALCHVSARWEPPWAPPPEQQRLWGPHGPPPRLECFGGCLPARSRLARTNPPPDRLPEVCGSFSPIPCSYPSRLFPKSGTCAERDNVCGKSHQPVHDAVPSICSLAFSITIVLRRAVSVCDRGYILVLTPKPGPGVFFSSYREDAALVGRARRHS